MTSLAAIIAGPMLFNYVQYIQSSLQEELDFCSHHTHGLWGEYEK
uniref:Nematode cuticle collagen N-terminal domain-containing protein n=1 Tax=Acrobeloides nanus TaxID=290746 RepID=A0A914CW76_9BILA